MKEAVATQQPLVSIVIPTYERPNLLKTCLINLEKQTYKNIEVIIVEEGPSIAHEVIADSLASDRIINYKFRTVNLGRNWTSILINSFGIAPLLVGYLMSKGDYIMPWCDDEGALTNYHIEKLVDLIENKAVDFVYPRVYIWRNRKPQSDESKVIGTDPPQHSQITHYLFRSTNLVKYGMPDWGTHPVDWHLIEKWMAAGATWAFLKETTFSHRLDQ